MATNITSADFKATVLKSDIPVLVDFWAEWCGPCKALSPVVDELATEYEGKALICKLDIEENADFVDEMSIMAVPTFILFKAGKEVSRFSGGNKESLKAAIDSAV